MDNFWKILPKNVNFWPNLREISIEDQKFTVWTKKNFFEVKTNPFCTRTHLYLFFSSKTFGSRMSSFFNVQNRGKLYVSGMNFLDVFFSKDFLTSFWTFFGRFCFGSFFWGRFEPFYHTHFQNTFQKCLKYVQKNHPKKKLQKDVKKKLGKKKRPKKGDIGLQIFSWKK